LSVRPDPEIVDVFLDALHQRVIPQGFPARPRVVGMFRVEDHHAGAPAVMVEPDLVDVAIVGISHGSKRLDQFDLVIRADLFPQFAGGALLGGFVCFDMPGGETPEAGAEFQLWAAFQQQEFMPVIFQDVDGKTGFDAGILQNSSSASAMMLSEPAQSAWK